MYREKMLLELKSAYGFDANFREGQAEAIQGVLKEKRTLVVQKTGWGKSLVYFLATKILKEHTKGFTLIISPLLALMNNQIDSAEKLGLQVETINSSNKDSWDEVMEKLESDQVDALIISPERLANDDFKQKLIEKLAAQIILFVVDEANCISDWGHDFRPDYRRIVDIVNRLPSNIPVLATTATANNRVISDIKKQLGDELLISRGSLVRESLAIQILHVDTKEERLTWLSDNINVFPGTGIIYCLTTKDCQLVSGWLNKNKIACESYYSGIEKAEGKNKRAIVDSFMNNQIKVLAATVAFGMGIDKPDIGFVIHFQKPKNLVEYYQQIGRAGRNIDKAYVVLLCGKEDDEINQYFIDSAFPTEALMDNIIEVLLEHPGLNCTEMEKYVDMKPSKISACLKYLLVNGDIYEEKKRYYKAVKPWLPDLEKSREITEIRKKELDQINNFTKTSNCYMQFIANVLDDTNAKECGKCFNCLKKSILPFDLSLKNVEEALAFLKEDFNIIEPRKKWPPGVRVNGKNTISENGMCETGLVLSNYGIGWGKIVAEGKYREDYFSEELVAASYQLLKDFVKEHQIKWVTNIPSRRRPELVESFARRLSDKLGLEYKDSIEKIKDTQCQKELNNRYSLYSNANESFAVKEVCQENVLLVDDMVDSGWTFTVCGYKLREDGCGKVYPFALANSAGRSGD